MNGRINYLRYIVAGLFMLLPVRSGQAANYALSFDGDDEVLIPHDSSISFDSNSSFTIELWFMPTGNQGIYHLLGKRDACTHEFLNYQMARDFTSLLAAGSDAEPISTGYDPPQNEWTHFAFSYDGVLARVYVNGGLSVTTPYTVVGENLTPLKIGASSGTFCCCNFVGLIDEVRIWSAARTPEEVATYFNRQINPQTPGIVGYWSFDDDSTSQVVRDWSLSGNDGTLGVDSLSGFDDPIRILSSSPMTRLEHDAAVVRILAPDSVVALGLEVNPSAVVKNLGLSLDSIPVRFTIGNIYDHDTSVILLPAESAQVAFPCWQASELGSFAKSCYVSLSTDSMSLNDTVSGVVAVSDSLGPIVLSVSPNHVGNTGVVTVIVVGERFQAGAHVKLTQDGYGDVLADTMLSSVVSTTTIEAVFDLSGTVAGVWDLSVANPDGLTGTLNGGLLVEEGSELLWVNILGREQVLSGRPARYTIQWGNSGNIDIDNRVVLLSFPASLDFVTHFELPADTLGVHWDSLGNSFSDSSTTYLAVKISRLRPGEIREVDLDLTAHLALRGRSSEIRKYDADDSFMLRASALSQAQSAQFDSEIDRAYDELSGVDPAIQLAIDQYQSSVGQFYILLSDFRREFLSEFALDLPKTLILSGTLAIFLIVTFPEVFASAGVAAGTSIAIASLASFVNTGMALCRFMDSNAASAVELRADITSNWDPNDKTSSVGYGALRFVAANSSISYSVYFENVDSATASVDSIWIVDTLDTDFDWSTFEFGEVYPGNGPESIRPNFNVVKNFDASAGVITWGLFDINLPPDTMPYWGESWVSYSIKPKSSLPSGTRIENVAAIKFDVNDWILAPMDSVPIFNTIDDGSPSSLVARLPETTFVSTIPVSWSGSDEQAGSGVASYSIYCSIDNGPYEFWMQGSIPNTANYVGSNDHSYRFYSVARDNVGHTEQVPTTFDAQTHVKLSCGDIDCNGRIDVTDAVYLVNYIFAGGEAPNPIEIGDVDCNSRINITDAVYLINYIFASGPQPCAACQ